MNKNDAVKISTNNLITTGEDFWIQANNFDNHVKLLPTKEQIIYNQAFEFYRRVFKNIYDDDYLERGYKIIAEKIFDETENGEKFDWYDLYEEFKNEAKKAEEVKDYKERNFLQSMSGVFYYVDIYNFNLFTKDDIELCKKVFSQLVNGEKFKEIPFEKEDAIRLKALEDSNLSVTKLENLVHTLMEDSRTPNIYVEINGVKLYSCDVTREKAFLQLINDKNSTIDDSTKKEYIDYLKKNAIEVNFNRRNIDNSVKILQEYREKGLNVYISCYNDIKLYSCDVTIDSAYVELTGETKAEFDKSIEENDKKRKAEQEQKKAELIAKIPSYIEEGKKIIYPERLEDWTKEIKSSIEGMYQGAPLIEALDLMKQLDKGESLEKVKETLDNKNVGGNAYEIVIRIVLNFSKRGPEFYEKATDNKLTGEIKQMVDDVKKENAILEEKHKNDSDKHEPDGSDDEPVESQSQDNPDEPDDFGDGDDDVE